MDKETMTKVNEILKANGRQALSMDELDKVVGGSFWYDSSSNMCTVDGKAMTPGEFNNIIYTVCESLGYDVALNALTSMTGWSTDFVSSNNKTDMERIGVVMTRFWNNYGEGRTY